MRCLGNGERRLALTLRSLFCNLAQAPVLSNLASWGWGCRYFCVLLDTRDSRMALGVHSPGFQHPPSKVQYCTDYTVLYTASSAALVRAMGVLRSTMCFLFDARLVCSHLLGHRFARINRSTGLSSTSTPSGARTLTCPPCPRKSGGATPAWRSFTASPSATREAFGLCATYARGTFPCWRRFTGKRWEVGLQAWMYNGDPVFRAIRCSFVLSCSKSLCGAVNTPSSLVMMYSEAASAVGDAFLERVTVVRFPFRGRNYSFLGLAALTSRPSSLPIGTGATATAVPFFKSRR